MQPKKFRRRKKLIKPGIQLRLVFSFVGLSVMGLTLQFLLLVTRSGPGTSTEEVERREVFESLSSSGFPSGKTIQNA